MICIGFTLLPFSNFVILFFVVSGLCQVDTGWMQRSKLKEGPAARNVQQAHVVALVLDAEEVSGIL